MNRLLVILAVAYILMPYDLLSDFIPVRGWIDDILVACWLAYRYWQYRSFRTGTEAKDKNYTPRGKRGNQTDKAPHQILQVAPDASAGQIKAAYRRLALKYHPDKFNHLDEDFRRLAEERFRQIQNAYQAMISKADKDAARR